MTTKTKQENTEIGIPEGWVKTTLGEVVDIKYGKDHKTLSDGDIPCYGSGGLMRGVEKHLYEKPSVLIPRKGTLSNLFYVDQPFWTVDTLFYTDIDTDKILPKYLFYKLSSENLENLNVGSAVPSLTVEVLNVFKLTIPPLSEQKIIIDALSSLDNKIELLHEQNITLEKSAQTIFNEWFGEYRAGDKLPDNWQVKVLDDVVDLIIDHRGKTPKKLGMEWSDCGIKALSAKTIKNGKIIREDAMNLGSEELYSLWMKDELSKGDILLTSEAPLGELYYLNDDTKYILSQRLFAIRAGEQITSQYLYYYLASPMGQFLLNARASGSTVQGIRQSELRKIEVVIPESELLKKASKVFKSILDKISLNDKQVSELVKTRDVLLPKLVKGDIRIN